MGKSVPNPFHPRLLTVTKEGANMKRGIRWSLVDEEHTMRNAMLIRVSRGCFFPPFSHQWRLPSLVLRRTPIR